MKFSKIIGLATLVAASTVAHVQAAPVITVGTFTGSAAGAGLDLQGNFVYAVTMNPNAAGVVLGNAQFTYALETNDVAVSHQYYIQDWYSSTYTGSAEDVGLGKVMESISWSGSNYQPDSQVLSVSMAALTIGQTYKAQFLFAENCCERGFNFYQDGVRKASDFSPYAETGNHASYANMSAVLTDIFTATSTSVIFGLGGNANFNDNNPILNAATLENVTAVPEPETFALVLAGLGALGFVARRKSL